MALPPQASAEASALAGKPWIVERIGGAGIVDNSRVTLQFASEGRLAGIASCNRYTAAYTAKGGSLAIGPAAATRMACAPALMSQESRFLALLATVVSFQIDQSGALVLGTADGGSLLARR